jgi:hypothetical protein
MKRTERDKSGHSPVGVEVRSPEGSKQNAHRTRTRSPTLVSHQSYRLHGRVWLQFECESSGASSTAMQPQGHLDRDKKEFHCPTELGT